MSMLKLITKATAAGFPLILKTDSIFPLLKPNDDGPDLHSPDTVARIIASADARLIASTDRLSAELHCKLAASIAFSHDELHRLLTASYT